MSQAAATGPTRCRASASPTGRPQRPPPATPTPAATRSSLLPSRRHHPPSRRLPTVLTPAARVISLPPSSSRSSPHCSPRTRSLDPSWWAHWPPQVSSSTLAVRPCLTRMRAPVGAHTSLARACSTGKVPFTVATCCACPLAAWCAYESSASSMTALLGGTLVATRQWPSSVGRCGGPTSRKTCLPSSSLALCVSASRPTTAVQRASSFCYPSPLVGGHHRDRLRRVAPLG